MKRIVIVPPPKIGGGPSNAVLRLTDVIRENGISVTTNLLSAWNSALLNVGVGIRYDALRVVRMGRRVVFRTDGSYVREIFNKEGNPWKEEYDEINARIALALKETDYVIYQSNFSKAYLDRLYRRQEGSYSIINNGVDLDIFCPVKREPNSMPIVGCVGTFRLNRIQTIISIVKQLNFTHRLLLVGRMDDASLRLVKNFQQHPSPNCTMQYIPPVYGDGQLVEIYRMIDCFIHPVIGDTCANAVVEALACGVPVVVPAFGGTSEVIGKGGLIVKNPRWEDFSAFIDEFVEAISRILADQHTYATFAREQAVSTLDIHHFALAYRRVLGV